MWDRLVKEVVANYGAVISIACGDFLPQDASLLLRTLINHQPGISVTVVDVVSGLTAGSSVHIQQHIDIIFLTPRNGLVEIFVAMYIPPQEIIMGQQTVVERQSYEVHTGLCQPFYVGFGDIIFQV